MRKSHEPWASTCSGRGTPPCASLQEEIARDEPRVVEVRGVSGTAWMAPAPGVKAPMSR